MKSPATRATILLLIAIAAAFWVTADQGSAGPPAVLAGSTQPATPTLIGTPLPPIMPQITATPSAVTRISIPDAVVSPGETFTVALEAVSDPPGFYGFNIQLGYPDGLLHATSCSTLDGFACTFGDEPDIIRLFGHIPTAMTGALTLANITFRAGGYNCESALRLHGPDAFVLILDDTWDDIARTVKDGLVTIEGGPASASGDVNCDGIDAIDAALVLQVDAGLLDELPFPEHGDVSRDGRTDSADAALILQFVSGLLDRLGA